MKIEVQDIRPLPKCLKANNGSVNLLDLIGYEGGAELTGKLFLKRPDERLYSWRLLSVICHECHLHSLALRAVSSCCFRQLTRCPLSHYEKRNHPSRTFVVGASGGLSDRLR